MIFQASTCFEMNIVLYFKAFVSPNLVGSVPSIHSKSNLLDYASKLGSSLVILGGPF